MGQEGSLARRHNEAPGLPRGRSSLPVSQVRAAQRLRLLTATVAAVAELGYNHITVADIVRGAKVSRAAFYAHFSDKQDCFLAATRYGGELLLDAVLTATRSQPRSASAERVLRASCRAYLAFLAGEPAFARVFYVDMAAAGGRSADRFETAIQRFADLTKAWHERARERHPNWPDVPDEAYLALSGAVTALVRVRVRQGKAAELPDLEDTLVALHLAVLAARRWPS